MSCFPAIRSSSAASATIRKNIPVTSGQVTSTLCQCARRRRICEIELTCPRGLLRTIASISNAVGISIIPLPNRFAIPSGTGTSFGCMGLCSLARHEVFDFHTTLELAIPAFSSAYDAPFCQHRRVFRTSSRDWTCIRCRFPDTEILHLGALFRRKHELKLLLAHRNRQRDQIALLAGVRDRRPIGELWHREVQHALNVALGRNGVGQKLALLQLFGACVALRQLRTVAVADFTVAQLASQVTRF